MSWIRIRIHQFFWWIRNHIRSNRIHIPAKNQTLYTPIECLKHCFYIFPNPLLYLHGGDFNGFNTLTVKKSIETIKVHKQYELCFHIPYHKYKQSNYPLCSYRTQYNTIKVYKNNKETAFSFNFHHCPLI